MQSNIRRKLAMGVRVYDFSRAHPSTDASYNNVFARLEDRLNRADTLALQQRAGQLGEHAAVMHRDEIRLAMRQRLRHLVRVAAVAAKDQPELAGSFELPPRKVALKAFITAAKAMLTRALADQELFVSLGVGGGFLEELSALVAQFDQTTESVHKGRRDHVGARADLEAVTDEIVEVVGLLDGLNRVRFEHDPELLAAWDSARNVAGPFRTKAAKPADGSGEQDTPPTPGGIAPAA